MAFQAHLCKINPVPEIQIARSRNWVRLGVIFIFAGSFFLSGVGIERYRQRKPGNFSSPIQIPKVVVKPAGIYACNEDSDCHVVIDKSKPCPCNEAINKEFVAGFEFEAYENPYPPTAITEANIACDRCSFLGSSACVNNRCGLVWQKGEVNTSIWKTFFENKSKLKFKYPSTWKVISKSKNYDLWPDIPESAFWFMDVTVADENGRELLKFRDIEPEMGSPVSAIRADQFVWLPDRKTARGVLGIENGYYFEEMLSKCGKSTIGNNEITNGDDGWYCLDNSWGPTTSWSGYYVYVVKAGYVDEQTWSILDAIVLSHSK